MPLIPIIYPGPQADFLKGSSAIWWQAEAVPRGGKLEPGFPQGSAFQDLSQWGSHHHTG